MAQRRPRPAASPCPDRANRPDQTDRVVRIKLTLLPAETASRRDRVTAEPRKTPSRPHDARWKLQDAKACFSELVRRARTEGPQRVTVRGDDAVVVIAADELERLLPLTSDALPFVTFMESLSVDGLDLNRDRDLG